MNGPTRILFAGLVMSGVAHAQEWHTYTYPDPGFAIQFPAAPEVQTATFKNAVGVTLPVTRYVVRQDGVQYTLSVVNYSSTNADALSIIGETARSFSAKGRVNSNTGARVNGSSGRELTVTERDGSRSDIAIFFFDKHLYTAVGQALPPHPMDRSADTARFQQSLQFLAADSGFFGLFAGRSRTGLNTAASTGTVGRSTANGVGAGVGSESGTGTASGNGSTGGNTTGPVTDSDSGNATGSGTGSGPASGTGRSTGGGGSSHAGEHPRTAATQRADAACAGKSAGDIVQLETPAGPVAATCILTARPNPPSGTPTTDGSPEARKSRK